jgi:hypothetical protein
MLATDLGLALPLLALPTNRDRVAERGALCLGQAAAWRDQAAGCGQVPAASRRSSLAGKSVRTIIAAGMAKVLPAPWNQL